MENRKKFKPDNTLTFGAHRPISEKLDTNDRKKLIESTALLDRFFNSPGAMRGVVEIEDHDVRHIADNAVSAKFFGRTQESMVNMLSSQMGINQEIIDIWIKYYEESKHTKQPAIFEYEHKIGNKTLFFLSYCKLPR